MYTINQCLYDKDTNKIVKEDIIYHLNCDKHFLIDRVIPKLNKLANAACLQFIKADSKTRVCFVVKHVKVLQNYDVVNELNIVIKKEVVDYNRYYPDHQVYINNYLSVFKKGEYTLDDNKDYVIKDDEISYS